MKFRPHKIIRKIYPDMIWDLKSEKNKNRVFLTFDDGPTPEITTWILETLAKYNAKATFFCLGKNVELYPHQYKALKEAGHAVANHSYSHIRGWGVSAGRYIEDVDLADELIHSNLYRPPYGRITRAQSRRLSERYNMIMWDVLSRDYSSWVSPSGCLKNVIKNVEGGSIVVFHDSTKAFRRLRYVLPRVLEYLYKNGYECHPIIL